MFAHADLQKRAVCRRIRECARRSTARRFCPRATSRDSLLYLSKKHRQTAARLIPMTSYTPPYRGDLKGIVETLHSIQKDQLFQFFPGAMDARRAEIELRKVDPSKAVLTLPDYIAVLSELFSTYNLSAVREERLDAAMTADGVIPCPAGLWNYGLRVGIGYTAWTGAIPVDFSHRLARNEVVHLVKDGTPPI